MRYDLAASQKLLKTVASKNAQEVTLSQRQQKEEIELLTLAFQRGYAGPCILDSKIYRPRG